MKAVFLLIFIWLFALSAFAQIKEAQKIEEFGNATCEDIKARLQNFAILLNEDSKSKGFVFVYEGKYSKRLYDSKENSVLKFVLPRFGESAFLTQEMQKAMKSIKFPPEKLLFIDGGFRENFTLEFWLVPEGAKLPKPTPTLETMKYRKGAPLKIDCIE